MKTQNLKALTEEQQKAYLDMQHIIRINRKPRANRKVPEVRTHEYCLNLISKATTPRNKMLLELVYFCGLRVSEALNVSVEDINFKEEVLKVMKGKGNKQRLTPMPKPLTIDLKQWLSLENIVAGKLFKIKRVQAHNIIKKLDPTMHMHTLRHSYATHVYEHTHDLNKVKDLLGHENIGTTAIYAHVSTKEKKETIKGVFG